MEYKITQEVLEWNTGNVKGFSGKEFINLSNGAVKLVKIEPMSEYPEHLHPDKTEYAYVMEGNPEFVINDQSFTGKSGDFFIFPSNIKHAIKNNAVLESIVLIGSIQN